MVATFAWLINGTIWLVVSHKIESNQWIERNKMRDEYTIFTIVLSINTKKKQISEWDNNGHNAYIWSKFYAEYLDESIFWAYLRVVHSNSLLLLSLKRWYFGFAWERDTEELHQIFGLFFFFCVVSEASYIRCVREHGFRGVRFMPTIRYKKVEKQEPVSCYRKYSYIFN